MRLGPDGTFGPLRDLGPAPFGVDDVASPPTAPPPASDATRGAIETRAPENTGNLFSSADDMAFLNSSS